MDWIPTLDPDTTRPLYRRIADAIAADVTSGRLHRGQQLPTHRALATALGLDLTTVTRAYTEARRRGLTEARVGLGTFVADSGLRPPGSSGPAIQFDLSMNLPPMPLEADVERRITVGLAAIQREHGFSAYLNYQQPGGAAAERDAAAAWLRARIPKASDERLVIFPGTQTALICLLLTLTKPGDTVLTEALTYPGMKAAAAYAGVRLVGVPTDAAGILPDALEAACQRYNAKLLYLIPTIHNPTTVTMTPARREEIVAVLRRRDLMLIEDDAYGALVPDVVPVAALAPERTYCAVTLSKCIAPGLRTSLLLCPDRTAADQLTNALRAAVQMPVPLMRALATRWLRDGSADAIITAVRDEAAARQKLAVRALSGYPYAANPKGHHIWVNLPPQWSRAEFASHVQAQGLAVVTSETFSVEDVPSHAIRVSLGAARNRAELVEALDVLAVSLKSTAVAARIV